jgi:hypothetical protein
MTSFSAVLEPVSHGGHFVVVPRDVADAAGVKYNDRVRGEVNGVAYRSSLAKYSGVFHLGLPKASLGKTKDGARVEVTLELDDEPRAVDTMPPAVKKALAPHAKAQASWKALSPSQRREFVKLVLDAKKVETRARRIEKIVATLKKGVPARKTWVPKDQR